MQEFVQWVQAAQQGDLAAFSRVVNRFQDMAFSLAYARLGHVQLAEDAAQEAFIEAYRHLGSLQDPATFPGWFQAIVVRRSIRLTRRKEVVMVPLETADLLATSAASPENALERRERVEAVQQAIQLLPAEQRQVTLLYYIADYSQKEIADLLGIRISTVKSRLHTARSKLRARIMMMTEENLRQQRPSQNDTFVQGVMEMISAIEQGDLAKVEAALQKRPALATATNEYGATALHYAAWYGAKEAANLLLSHGANLNLRDGKHDAPPIGWAGENGQRELFDFFLARGATVTIGQAAGYGTLKLVQSMLKDNPALVNRGTEDNPTEWAPLWTAAYFRQHEILDFLLKQGAQVNARTRRGETALHGAVAGGDRAIVERLLAAGAEVNAPNEQGATPLHRATWQRSREIVALLLAHQARVDGEDQHGFTPLELATMAEGITVDGWGTATAEDSSITELLEKHRAEVNG